MVKPSRSRSSLFSHWTFDTGSKGNNNSKGENHNHNSPSTSVSTSTSTSTPDPYSPRETLSPSTTTSTSTPFTSPGSYLSSDPFRYSLALPAPYTTSSSSPYYKEAIAIGAGRIGNESPYGGLAEEDTDDDNNNHQKQIGNGKTSNPNQDQNRYNPHSDAVKSTESLVSGTATTPKITLASPSTSTIHHYLFPDPQTSLSSSSSGSSSSSTSNLDPSAARKIAKSISKRQSGSSTAREARERERAVEEEEERKRLESAFPDPPTGKPNSSPLRPTRRVVSPSTFKVDLNTDSGANENQEIATAASPVVRKDEKHPLSMRTLRRQPSMADLGNQNKKLALALGDPIELRQDKGSGDTKGRLISENKGNDQNGQVSDGWKGTLRRRESEAWRELVGNQGWDTSAHAVSPELISPMTTSFPSNIHDFSNPAPHSSVRARHVSPVTSRARPEAIFDHPQAGLSSTSTSPQSILIGRDTANANGVAESQGARKHVTPIYPSPYIADQVPVSQSPVYSYNQLDFSISTASASGMSRCGTLGCTRLDSIPMSVEMERDVPRVGLGSYDSGKLAARADALRRLSGYTTGSQGQDRDQSRQNPEASFSTLRRTVSFKKESKKEKRATGDGRPRAYSLSAKMAREIGISSPVPMPMPTSSKRETLSPSRGIYLGDLSVDLGGRYGDRQSLPARTSPTSTGGTSLYPASSTSSYFPRQCTISGRPLHPALSSEISLLAPSSVGLGFSPVGSPASLPESLQAEAIDLTGNYGHAFERDTTSSTTRMNRLPKRTSSLHYLKSGSPTVAPPLPDMPTPDLHTSPEPQPEPVSKPKPTETVQQSLPPKDKPRRSFLLAQNTFYIPPLVAPPSLRSSRSLSNLHPSQPSTPTSLVPPTPLMSNKAYTKRSHNRRGTGAFGICSPEGIDPLPLSPGDHTSPLSLSSVPPSIRLERKRSSPFMNASASIRMMFTQNPIARSLSRSFDKDRESRESPANTTMDTQLSVSATLKSKISGPVENDGERMWREGLLREAVTASLGGSVSKTSSSEQPRTTPNPNRKSRLAIPEQFLQSPVEIDQSRLEVEIDTATLSFAEERQQERRERRESRSNAKAASGISASANVAEYSWATFKDSPIRVDANSGMYTATRARSASTSTVSHKRKSRPPTPILPRLGSNERSTENDLPPLPTEGNLSKLFQTTSPPRFDYTQAPGQGQATGTNGTMAHTTDDPLVEGFQSGVTVRRKPTPYYSRNAPKRVLAAALSEDSGGDDDEDQDGEDEEDEDDEEESLTHDTAPPSYLKEIHSSFDRIQAQYSNFETSTSSRAPITNTSTTASKIEPRPRTTTTVPESKCLARSVRSISTSLRPRLSKPKLNLAEPVSSTTPVPLVPILSTLSAREKEACQRRAAAGGGGGQVGDKEKKFHEWRTEVEENGDLARLEERIIKHVEREREALRDLGRREGSGSSSNSH